MSWIDRLGRAAHGGWNVVTAVPGAVIGIATSPLREDEYSGVLETLTGYTGAATSKWTGGWDETLFGADEAFGAAVPAALKTMQWAYDEGVSQPLSTFGIQAQRLGVVDWDPAGFFDPGKWADAYHEAEHTSPGRVLFTSNVKLLEWGIPGQQAAEKYDTFTYQGINAAVKNTWGGDILSGAADFTSNVFLDPTVIGGKIAKVVKLATYTKPIGGTRVVLAPVDVDEMVNSRPVNRLIDRLFEKPQEQRLPWLLHNTTLNGSANKGALARLMAEAENPAQVRLLLRAAASRDPVALEALYRERAELADSLVALSDQRIPTLNALASGAPGPSIVSAQLELLNKTAARNTERYNELLDELDIAGTLEVTPRIRPLDRPRTSWTQYTPSISGKNALFNGPLRVLKSASTMRPGSVDLNRADGYNNLGRFLDQTGVGGADKTAIMSAYIGARTEAAKTGALERAERVAMHTLAARLGIDPKLAQVALSEGWRRRDELFADLKMRAYTAALKGEKTVDVYDVDGVPTRLPVDVVQLRNYHPLLDVQAATRMLKRHAPELEGKADDLTAALESIRSGKLPSQGAAMLEEFGHALIRVWKPMQLLRLGWPQRVLLDEHLRIIATMGVFSHLPLVARSIKAGHERLGARQVSRFAADTQRNLERQLRAARRAAAADKKDARLADRVNNLQRMLNHYQALGGDAIARAAQVGFAEDVLVFGPYRLEDAFTGSDAYARLASSQGFWRRWSDDSGRELARLRTEANHVEIAGSDPAWPAAWENAVNNQFRNSPIWTRMLAGQSDDQILRFLKTREGREIRTRIGFPGGNPEKWVDELRTILDDYLPSDELQALAAKRNLKASDFAASGLPRMRVHGPQLDYIQGKGEIAKAWSRFVEKAYTTLGSAPTDVLSRHPFFANIYRSKLRALIREFDPELTGRIGPEVQTRLARQSREYALQQTRRVLYDIATESNLAHTLRYLFPFYAPWQEVLTTWTRLFVEDPSRLARAAQVAMAPRKSGWVEQHDGEDKLVAHLPGWAKKIPGFEGVVESIGVSPQQFNLALQGPTPFLPGAGPLVAIPVAQAARSRPDITETLKWALPYGPQSDVFDLFLPAYAKRFVSRQQENEDFLKAQNKIISELEYERTIGKNRLSDTELAAEAHRRAKDFFKLRTIANFTLPASPSYYSPYQFYWDKMREYTERYGEVEGEEQFLKEFGDDYFAFTSNFSKSVDSIAPTMAGFEASRKYSDLIAAEPDYASLWVGDTDTGSFNGAVYDWQFRAQIGAGDIRKRRVLPSPLDKLREDDRKLGWVQWHRGMQLINAEMIERNLDSLNQAGAEPLRRLKQMLYLKLAKDHPEWAKDFDTFDVGRSERTAKVIAAHMDDPRFANRPGWGGLRRYITARQQVTALLGRRAAAGGTANLQAQANEDVRAVWERYVGELIRFDLAFADIYERWFGAISTDPATGALDVTSHDPMTRGI